TGHRAIQDSYTGSTRATGVCWSMNSLTMTAHGPASLARHGKSLRWIANQARVRSVTSSAIAASKVAMVVGVAAPASRAACASASAGGGDTTTSVGAETAAVAG